MTIEPVLEIFTPIFNPTHLCFQAFVEPHQYIFGYPTSNNKVRPIARCKIPVSEDDWKYLFQLIKFAPLSIDQKNKITQFIIENNAKRWIAISQ